MKIPAKALLGIAACLAAAAQAMPAAVAAPESAGGMRWGTPPPLDCPFPASQEYSGIEFTGRYIRYLEADTWYPSWANDGKLYTPFCDGIVNGVAVFGGGEAACTGYAALVGDDPLHLAITGAGKISGPPAPYSQRYACGTLVCNGVWFYGTYSRRPLPQGSPHPEELGPFVGFRWSTDQGRTWTESGHNPAHPLFGESGGRVRIGSPNFVDFGKNMRYAPDGKAYLVAHGSDRGGYCSWSIGDQTFVLRVRPKIGDIDNAASYEFFAGFDGRGKPQWVHDLKRIVPVAEWPGHMGPGSVTYVPQVAKFLLWVTDGPEGPSNSNTYLLEADRIEGPWRLVEFLRDFGPQAYFANIPSKFISSDGLTFWLCYSANYTAQFRPQFHFDSQIRPRRTAKDFNAHFIPGSPPGSGYALVLREVRLLRH